MPTRDHPRRRWFDPLGGASASTPRGRPLAPVSAALDALADRRGWRSHLAAGRLEEVWPEIVGPELAAQTSPVRLAGGVLVLRAASPMWAAEVRQLGGLITERVNARLGAGSVHNVRVSVRRSTGG